MLLRDVSELRPIREEWSELVHSDLRATPFQSPQWLLPWWDHFGGDGELAVIASRNASGRLEGLLPLYVVRDDDESLGMLIGTGVSDYLDLVGTGPAFGDFLQEVDCQIWDLQQIRPGSPLLTLPAGNPFSDHVEDHDSSFLLDLRGAVSPLAEAVDAGSGNAGRAGSSHARKKLRYSQRLLAREGTVTFAAADTRSVDALMDALFALHAARWNRRGLPGVLADPETQAFHRSVAEEMFEAGMLRLHALMIDETPRAVFYGFALHETTYYYLSGFDPALEKAGIGNLLVAHAIAEAMKEGAAVFDFLRGDEGYKTGWGASPRRNHHRILTRS